MKILLLTFANLLFQLNLNAQTAEEIISKTEYTYQHLSNYVDQGEFRINSLAGAEYATIVHYFLALDASKNVKHWFSKDYRTHNTQYSYTKTAELAEGTFTRNLEGPESLPATIEIAAARIGGGGGHILGMVASLLYPDFYGTSDPDSTPPNCLRRYKELNRMQDTSLENELCYVLQLTNRVKITQAMIDHTKRYIDSMNYVKALKTTPTASLAAFKGSSNYNEEPGVKTSVAKYFIRKKDNLIVRRDYLNYNGNEPYYVMDFKLNPKVNVENFQEYISQ